jgi:hypothetical protein
MAAAQINNLLMGMEAAKTAANWGDARDRLGQAIAIARDEKALEARDADDSIAGPAKLEHRKDMVRHAERAKFLSHQSM